MVSPSSVIHHSHATYERCQSCLVSVTQHQFVILIAVVLNNRFLIFIAVVLQQSSHDTVALMHTICEACDFSRARLQTGYATNCSLDRVLLDLELEGKSLVCGDKHIENEVRRKAR